MSQHALVNGKLYIFFDFAASDSFGLKVKTLCGEMHFLLPQLANYWLQQQIQPNVFFYLRL